MAGISVQSGRYIDCQRWHAAGLHQVQPLDYLGRGRTVGIQRGANSQQGVNAKIEIWWWLFSHVHAGCQRAVARSLGVGWQTGFAWRQAGPGNCNGFAPLLQLQRRLETVAAVVARAAGNPDAAGMRRQGKRQSGHCQAGALHQGVRRQGGRSQLFCSPGAGYGVERMA